MSSSTNALLVLTSLVYSCLHVSSCLQYIHFNWPTDTPSEHQPAAVAGGTPGRGSKDLDLALGLKGVKNLRGDLQELP